MVWPSNVWIWPGKFGSQMDVTKLVFFLTHGGPIVIIQVRFIIYSVEKTGISSCMSVCTFNVSSLPCLLPHSHPSDYKVPNSGSGLPAGSRWSCAPQIQGCMACVFRQKNCTVWSYDGSSGNQKGESHLKALPQAKSPQQMSRRIRTLYMCIYIYIYVYMYVCVMSTATGGCARPVNITIQHLILQITRKCSRKK